MAPHLLSLPQIIQIFMSSFAALIGLRFIAPKLGLVDRPGGRKAHVGHIPVVGGLGVFLGASIGLWSTNALTPETLILLPCFSAIVVLGTLDDRFDLPASIKLVGQFVISTLLVALFPRELLADPFFNIYSSLNNIIVVLFFVGCMNALNMLDGVDGLAGGVSCISLSLLTLVVFLSGGGTLPLASAFLASVLAFLSLNARSPWLPRATIFLGDSGSMLLGIVLAYLSVELTSSPSKWSILHSAFFVAFPAFETTSVAARRLFAGRSPFSADRTHLHHLLQQRGWTPSAIALVLSFTTGALGLVGVALHASEASAATSIIVLALAFLTHCALIFRLTSCSQSSFGFIKHIQE